MNLALACVFFLLGASWIAVASHGLEASTPWQLFQTILTRARGA